MAMQWNENLAVGVDAIDNQHKGIFIRVNNLLDAMVLGKGEKYIVEIIEYVGVHFNTEENLMNKYNYISYVKQKTEHMLFIKYFFSIKRELETQGVSSQLLIQTHQLLYNWLKSHIAREDKKFCTFIKKCA
ncbi:MAG TPA: bacteriohemerythrin [Candidatus Wunengus sp. YC60]|jgi:hemerythrin|uniref:bacteriohemerythrin n=1 Tax=Candidatus Wunengus sp. YC60 TaxID=3367697 RepID=UPI004029DC6D